MGWVYILGRGLVIYSIEYIYTNIDIFQEKDLEIYWDRDRGRLWETHVCFMKLNDSYRWFLQDDDSEHLLNLNRKQGKDKMNEMPLIDTEADISFVLFRLSSDQ